MPGYDVERIAAFNRRAEQLVKGINVYCTKEAPRIFIELRDKDPWILHKLFLIKMVDNYYPYKRVDWPDIEREFGLMANVDMLKERLSFEDFDALFDFVKYIFEFNY